MRMSEGGWWCGGALRGGYGWAGRGLAALLAGFLSYAVRGTGMLRRLLHTRIYGMRKGGGDHLICTSVAVLRYCMLIPCRRLTGSL